MITINSLSYDVAYGSDILPCIKIDKFTDFGNLMLCIDVRTIVAYIWQNLSLFHSKNVTSKYFL